MSVFQKIFRTLRSFPRNTAETNQIVKTNQNVERKIVETNCNVDEYLAICRISWDNGIKSPSGFDHHTNDQELGFSEYYLDFLESKFHHNFENK